MPGGRLTLRDRQRIAADLEQGLSLAEIARRLDRPTSTVSREVARNGGPRGYRADRAQAATETRAKRAKTAHRPADTVQFGRGGRSKAVEQWQEQLTTLLVRAGLPQMAARVMVALSVTDSGSLTAAELVRLLRVSPASVSKAIGDLEAQALVRREREGRRDRYILDRDVWYRSWLASARMNAALAETANHGARLLGTATPAGARLRTTGEFLAQVTQDMLRAAQRWHKARQ